jgi:hypothetical protein
MKRRMNSAAPCASLPGWNQPASRSRKPFRRSRSRNRRPAFQALLGSKFIRFLSFRNTLPIPPGEGLYIGLFPRLETKPVFRNAGIDFAPAGTSCYRTCPQCNWLKPWVRLDIWTEGLPRRGDRTQPRAGVGDMLELGTGPMFADKRSGLTEISRYWTCPHFAAVAHTKPKRVWGGLSPLAPAGHKTKTFSPRIVACSPFGAYHPKPHLRAIRICPQGWLWDPLCNSAQWLGKSERLALSHWLVSG